jgi:hypothetical protein
MNRKFTVVIWLGLVGFALGMGFFVWTIVTSSRLNVCIMCKRPVHAETKTLALINGQRTLLCCPTCALMMRDNRGDDVELLEVTDLESGEPLNPREAYVVVGSDVNYCMREDAQVGQDKQPVPKSFDRCSPSMISFRELPAAERFTAEHGGEVVPGDLAFGFKQTDSSTAR